MKNTWQFQEAKNRLSEVVENALTHGHQIITRRGEPAVVVVAAKEFKQIKKPKESLSQFFAKSPLKGLDLDLERIKDFPREIKL